MATEKAAEAIAGYAPIFVEAQCEGCGSFWRFDEGKEPERLPSCPDCDPTLVVDGVRFIAGERGMAFTICAGCGHRWAGFREELEKHRGEQIVHCSRCDGDERHGEVQWGPIPNGESKMAKAKSNGTPDGGVEIDRYEEKLLCEIPDEDIAKKANDLAVTIEERDQVKQRRRATIATFKDKLVHLDEKINELGESVRTKAERRNVICVEYLVERQNKVILVRTDTGAVESERAATPEDRQEPMFAGEGRKSKRAKKAPKNEEQPAAPAE